MNKQLLHTPEGIRDIYERECLRKRAIERSIQEVTDRYGYQPIETPTFEFYDVFKAGKSSADLKNLYKFFDRNGDILVLRPDFTPSIARVCATALADSKRPIRLSYKGSTFLNHSSYRGELREVTELGVELIGDASVEADAEMIAMITDCMDAIGLKNYQIAIGQNDFFKSVVEQAGLDEETEEELRELTLNRNVFGVEELVEEKDVPMVERSIFLKLVNLFGGAEVLEEAYRLTVNDRGKQAVERIRKLYELLKVYGADEHVTFDFSMLGKYNYYTGVTFRVYTTGTGDAVIKGGRYDNLLGSFGTDAPSVGFVVVIDELMNAMTQQKNEMKIDSKFSVLYYDESEKNTAIRLAKKLRAGGQNIEMLAREANLSSGDLLEEAGKRKAENLLFIEEQMLKLINIKSGNSQEFYLDAILGKEEA